MDNLLKVLEAHRNVVVVMAILVIGGFLLSLIFSLEKPDAVMQALSNLIGAGVSGLVGAIVAINILRREEEYNREQAGKEAAQAEREIDATRVALQNWVVSVYSVINAFLDEGGKLLATSAPSSEVGSFVMLTAKSLGKIPLVPTLENRVITHFAQISVSLQRFKHELAELSNYLGGRFSLTKNEHGFEVPDSTLLQYTLAWVGMHAESMKGELDSIASEEPAFLGLAQAVQDSLTARQKLVLQIAIDHKISMFERFVEKYRS